MLYANNKDADQPVHSRSLINFVVRCLDNIIPIFAISKLSRLFVEQAGLRRTWSQIPEDRLSCGAAQIYH